MASDKNLAEVDEDEDTKSATPEVGDSKLFQVLRPICVDIMKQPTCAHFQKLSLLLQDIPPDLVPPQMVEYLIFPLSVHLKVGSKLRQEALIDLLKCLRIILARWPVTGFVMFLELFTRLNLTFGTDTDPTKLNPELSEDVLEPLASCLRDLVSRSLPYHRDMLYTSKYVPSIGHSIFMLLLIVTDNTVSSLRLIALDTLNELVKSGDGNEEACHQMFKFLPGLTTGLRKVCSIKPGRLHKKLVMRALSVFQKIISTSTCAETPETLQLADVNLSPVLRQISDSFLLSEDDEIKIGLAEFSVELAEPLTGKMPICTEILWNNVFVFASDQNQEIAQKCQTSIKSIPQSVKSELCSPETIMNLAKRALSLIKGHDDNGCLLLLNRITSTLEITSLPPVQLKEFLPLLVNLLSVSLIGNTTSQALEIELELKKNNKIRRSCSQLCLNLTLTSDLTDILDQLSELLKSVNSADWISSCRSAALVFIVNCIFKSCSGMSEETRTASGTRSAIESDEAIATVSTFVTSLSAQAEPSGSDGAIEKVPNVNLKAIDAPKFELSRAIYDLYLLEGLEVFLALDHASFHPFMLPEVMYILLEHAGREDYPFVSNAALKTLQSIAQDQSIECILSENLDLILSELSLRIKSKGAPAYSRLPIAVIFLAKYFDFSQKNFVKFVEDIFFRSDYQQDVQEQGKRQVLYAQLFFALVTSLRIHSTAEIKENDNREALGKNGKKSLLVRLLEYQKSVGMSIEMESVEEVPPKSKEASEEEGLQEPTEDEENPLPANPSLALRICNRVLHYLPLNNRPAKLSAMDILIKGIQILSPYENSLLPLAHQVWEYLVPRFEERDYVIVRKSFELLVTLCKASKTFLKKRTLVDIFPKLGTLLQKLGEESSKVKDKNRVYYTNTQAYKLQLCVLEGMAELCKSIEILERDLDRVANGCLLYLTPGQHKNLKDAAVKLLKELPNTEYGSTIWMKLIVNGICDMPPAPLRPEFRPVLLKEKERKF